jgi:regulator of protease activity HflC (stomatin/prohibitin superfamily)
MILFIIGFVLLLIGIIGIKSSPAAKFKGIVILVGVIVMIIGFLTATVKQINAGHVGVQIFFGKVQQDVLHEGLNIVNPLFNVEQMSVQTKNYTMSLVSDEGEKKGDDAIRVLSKDGLEVVIDLTVLYRVNPEDAPKIYREIGLSFEDKVVRPVTRTGIRESATYFNAIDLFSEKREEFENMLFSKISDEFKNRGLTLEQMLIRNISLPASVKESIERKITAVQDAQRMEFVLDKEEKEAERKRVEARGVADAQRIVNEGLSDKILQFEMIKVQKELAMSPNSKIIVLGGGKGSMPFILDTK